MTTAQSPQLLRAAVFHTPRNPFRDDTALESYPDGGLLIRDGRIEACGDFQPLRRTYPDAIEIDLRGGFLLPGLIDTHVHFPQLRALGCLGRSLLDWLEECALPEERKMGDMQYASQAARTFLRALVSHGTTSALVFGAHFLPATEALLEAADSSGLRIITGLVLSDRKLTADLHQTPEAAYRDSTSLIRQFHRRGRLQYAVTPRFALSTSEAMLEVCQTIMREHQGLRLQTHMNENLLEIEQVKNAFPWAKDYLAVYERFGLACPSAVMAHNVHPTDGELERLASSRTAIVHCPSSNAALGSGLFPLRRHLQAGVQCALGTDVGGGTGFGMLKEGLQAYLMQRIAPNGCILSAAHLLYLVTRAGAEALGLESETGDFSAGKAADILYLRPPEDSPLAEVLRASDSPERTLGALFTMASSESVDEVRVEGAVVYRPEQSAEPR